MNLRTASLSLLGALGARAQSEPVAISGSGTTNPSKCFWTIMSKFSEQIKIPTSLTYRAVGSGTGQKEFLGKAIAQDGGEPADDYVAYNDFGSGDIPIKAEDRTAWFAKGIEFEFVQLPFVLSAVSFFHNIPGVPSGDQGLNMTACLLSRVFSRDITTWDDPDILEINPNLNVDEVSDVDLAVCLSLAPDLAAHCGTHSCHVPSPPAVRRTIPSSWAGACWARRPRTPSRTTSTRSAPRRPTSPRAGRTRRRRPWWTGTPTRTPATGAAP